MQPLQMLGVWGRWTESMTRSWSCQASAARENTVVAFLIYSPCVLLFDVFMHALHDEPIVHL